MLALNMPMEIRPPQTGNITVLIGAVIPQQQNCIFEDLIPHVLDPKVVVRPHEIGLGEVFEFP